MSIYSILGANTVFPDVILLVIGIAITYRVRHESGFEAEYQDFPS